jgi:hypothetical protein
MKGFIYIFILILVYLVCSARSCNDNNRKDQDEKKLLSVSKDSIKQAFEVNVPSEEILGSYEVTASQKLIDFADYLKVASDPSLDIRFRRQAIGMTRRLFIPGDINIRNWCDAYHSNHMSTLDQLTEKCLSQGMTGWIQPRQVKLKMPLERKNDSTYMGQLSFNPFTISFDSSNAPQNTERLLSIDIYALKKEKTFGKDRLWAWEVRLGDIH